MTAILPQDMTQQELRTAITRKYARTVAVIDDEIMTGDGMQIAESFNQLRLACEEQGVLCHLYPYPRIVFSAYDTNVLRQVERAAGIAGQADVAILDWQLGPSGSEGSPEHALAIIDAMLKMHAMRFIVIYTTEKNHQRVATRLKEAFPDLTEIGNVGSDLPLAAREQEENLTEEQFITAATTPEGAPAPAPPVLQTNNPDQYCYHVQKRIFIFIRDKEQVHPERLLTDFCQSLQTVIPDYLRWAALEMSATIRSVMPCIMAALPEDTNLALRLQMLFQRRNEVAEQIAEVLLDEMRFHFQHHPLTAVADHTIFKDLQQLMAELLNDGQRLVQMSTLTPSTWAQIDTILATAVTNEASLTGNQRQALQRLRQVRCSWETASSQSLQAAAAGNRLISDFFPYRKTDEEKFACQAASEYIAFIERQTDPSRPCVAWAEIRESVLSVLPSEHAIMPGLILRRADLTTDGDGTETPTPPFPKWLLCITPACDCYRHETGTPYLFVTGEDIDNIRQSSRSQTQICLAGRHIVWDASNLLTLADPFNPTLDRGVHYQLAGALRYSFTMRVIQRVWAYQSRVGVDTSEMIRQLRAE